MKDRLFKFILFAFVLFSHTVIAKEEMVFVILTHCRDAKEDAMWRYSYNTVQQFYPNTPIVVIDDNSPYPVSDPNINIIRSEYPGAGETLPYYYFLKYQWAEKMVVLHDSMFLKRPFYNHELNHPLKFHWHFGHQYDQDWIIDIVLSTLPRADELIDYNCNNKDEWLGCFGVTSIIDLKVIKDIEEKYSFSLLTKTIKGRHQRSALERIFAMMLFREGYINKENCSNFGDIFSYPCAFEVWFEADHLRIIKETYPGAIIKTWRSR